jgi:hypothetical protein
MSPVGAAQAQGERGVAYAYRVSRGYSVDRNVVSLTQDFGLAAADY